MEVIHKRCTLFNTFPIIIVHGKRAVTADTAIHLARAPGTSGQFRMGLQTGCDLEQARRAARGELKKIGSIAARPRAATAPGRTRRYAPR